MTRHAYTPRTDKLTMRHARSLSTACVAAHFHRLATTMGFHILRLEALGIAEEGDIEIDPARDTPLIECDVDPAQIPCFFNQSCDNLDRCEEVVEARDIGSALLTGLHVARRCHADQSEEGWRVDHLRFRNRDQQSHQ